MKKPAAGFTLLETVIAMIIMAGGILLLANSWSGAFMRIRKTQTNFEVAAIIERKMNDIELEYRGKSLDDIPEEKTGDFGEEYKQYAWKLSSKKLEFPDLSAALMSKGAADQTLLLLVKQLTEALGKTIKEVTVTVTFTPKGKKPIDYTVTTYFVDYDKEIPLSIPGGG